MAERDIDGGVATMSANRRLLTICAVVCVAALALLAGRADSADAKAKIFKFESFPSTSKAGGHPDIYSVFEVGSRLTQEQVPCFCNDFKDIIQHAPAGVIANPHVASVCPIAQLTLFECPADSQVGLVVVQIFGYAALPLWRTTPRTGEAGLFAFALPFGSGVPLYLQANARTGSDYGLDIKSIGASHVLPLRYIAPIFWGVPGEHHNDFMRFAPGEQQYFGCSGDPLPKMLSGSEAAVKQFCPEGLAGKAPVPSSLPIAPFTQNPTTCVGPLSSTLETFAYDLQHDEASAPWPATTGCDALSFDPSLAANPTTSDTDTATGLEVTLKVPQFQDPETPSPSELKSNTVTLPEGFSINANAADGKTSCSDAQSRIGTEEEAQCPEFAKVGTVSLDSSALPGPIDGFIYLGEPKPGEPYRLVLTANGFGTAVKLLGTIHADPGTGQLVTSFENLPQTPFQEFVLHFFGSERGILATPTQCGKYPVKSTFVPWDASVSDQSQTQFFVLDHGPEGGPCPGPQRSFSPTFEAGTKDDTGGHHTSFGLKITRADGQQNLDGVTITTPPGFLATLRGIPYCPEAAVAELRRTTRSGAEELANPACPAASLIGTADTAEGAGTRPLNTAGRVYLSGPYRGAPLSMVVVIPAVSGPYDFGNVVTRVALKIDPLTAQITAVSDPLPKILAGVPLRLRMVQVNLNRPAFALNPTNCDPFSVAATLIGDQGATSTTAVPFQAANCTDLPYGPKLSLRLTGGVRRRGHPAIQAVLDAAPGEANTKRVAVSLPPGELLDQKHIDTVCTRPQLAADSCPAGSDLGDAEVTTPLLDRPLKGHVFLRTNPTGKLPDLALDLEGQIDIEIVGRISTDREGALRTTFATAPDAPVDRVVLNLKGGKAGLLQNSRSLCGATRKAKVQMVGQNGWVVNRKISLGASCGGTKGKRDRARGRIGDEQRGHQR